MEFGDWIGVGREVQGEAVGEEGENVRDPLYKDGLLRC